MPAETAANTVEWAARVALDWGDRKHAWALQAAGCPIIEQGQIEASAEAVEAWAAGLAERFAGRHIAVVLEQSRGALLFMLTKFAHLVLHSMHPGTLARYRQAMTPSGAKDDPPDALFLLDFLTRHPERLRRWQPDSTDTRELQFLVESRRSLVDEKTRQTHRLRDRLKLYFPHVLQWFDDLDSPMVQRFLDRWPVLGVLQKEPADTLREFFRQSNCRSAERIEELIRQIAAARPAVDDPAVVDTASTMAKIYLEQIALSRRQIAQLQDRIEAILRRHPDAPVIRSFPAAGPAMAPRLLVALGTHRDRYNAATDVACYSGIAPVLQRSGQRRCIHVRRACPKFVRQTFHEWAACTARQCDWARQFYLEKRKQGKGHHAAVRALAYKWIRIIYRCWKDNVPYDENRYNLARAKRHAGQSNLPKFEWQSSSGFSRFAGPAS